MFGSGVSRVTPSRLLGTIPILFIFISRWLINVVVWSIIFFISFPKLHEPFCASRVSVVLTKGAREQARQEMSWLCRETQIGGKRELGIVSRVGYCTTLASKKESSNWWEKTGIVFSSSSSDEELELVKANRLETQIAEKSSCWSWYAGMNSTKKASSNGREPRIVFSSSGSGAPPCMHGEDLELELSKRKVFLAGGELVPLQRRTRIGNAKSPDGAGAPASIMSMGWIWSWGT